MSRPVILLILFCAALLEAGGDALIRSALHTSSGLQKTLLFALGAAVLFSYGWAVNAPPWDFGKLLGIYVVFFFVVAQLVSWLVFHQAPSLAVWIGGALIVSGGMVIAVFQG